MKLFIILLSLFASGLVFGETYETVVKTKTLGELRIEVQIDLHFSKLPVPASRRYFQERIDQGQWGDFFCINEVKFENDLRVQVKVFNAKTNRFLGSPNSDRYDRRKGHLVVRDIDQSPLDFKCETTDLSGNVDAVVDGYDARLAMGDFSFGLSFLSEAKTEVYVSRRDENTYALAMAQIEDLMTSTDYKIQFTVDEDHGPYMNNYEWGTAILKKK